MQLTERFEASLGQSASSAQHLAARELCQALDQNRINFGLEPFHNLSATPGLSSSANRMPMEYLLRPASVDGRPIDLGPALRTLREMGLIGQLDMVIIPRAIEQALSYGAAGFPVSVNIAPESLKDSVFLNEMGIYLNSLKNRIPDLSDVVLEIPLDGSTTHEAVAWLRQLKAQGFRIAIDNFGHYAPLEYAALNRLNPDFVKIDGAIVESALAGAPGLSDIVEGIRKNSSDTRLLAAWVTSIEEAKRLHDAYGIDAVQGRKLPKDRTYFDSQWDFLLYAEQRAVLS